MFFTEKEMPSLTSTNVFCCEDHFNLQEDCENLLEFNTIGSRLRMKKDVVPHLNMGGECVTESQVTSSTKKRKIQNIEVLHSRRKLVFESTDMESGVAEMSETPEKEETVASPSGKFHITTTSTATQVNIKKPYRSISTNTSNIVLNKSTQTQSNIHIETQIPMSEESDSDTVIDDSESTSYQPSTTSSSPDRKYTFFERKIINRNNTLMKLENHSRFYLGLPQEEYFLIKLLSNHVKANCVDILITIKKIRLNDVYYRLGVDFDFSIGMISQIFNRTVPKIANELQDLIYWPEELKIKMNLPSQFVARYKNVQSVIDCLEIQIETPTNALHQAQTWSQYKKCNTAKFLISSTPYFLVNFISEGFGCRTSDKEIIEKSNYLKELPDNCTVMADRGFKNIEHLLAKKKCRLVRPPTVLCTEKPTREQVSESKRIAALRIHIERVIRRIREFKMLAPHACVNTQLVHLLDYIIIIVCGIINIQGLLVKH